MDEGWVSGKWFAGESIVQAVTSTAATVPAAVYEGAPATREGTLDAKLRLRVDHLSCLYRSFHHPTTQHLFFALAIIICITGDSLRKSFLLSLISTIEGRFPRDKQLKGKLTVVKNDLNGCLVTTHQTERVEFPPLTSALLVAVSSYVFFGILGKNT